MLNYTEPIIIKLQLEQMREQIDVVEKNYVLLINDQICNSFNPQSGRNQNIQLFAQDL